MMRYLILAIALAGGVVSTATAQTTQPARPAPADTTSQVEGVYVGPGMTGAPKQQVTTDYNNQPLKRAKKTKSKSSTLSADEQRQPATTPPRRP